MAEHRSRVPLEPFLWLGFAAGGVLAALFLPILVVLFGIAFPLGWIEPKYEQLSAVVTHPLTLVVMFVVCALSLLHAGHRFRYTLYDGLQMQHLDRTIAVLCYGGAIVGTVGSAYILLTAG